MSGPQFVLVRKLTDLYFYFLDSEIRTFRKQSKTQFLKHQADAPCTFKLPGFNLENLLGQRQLRPVPPASLRGATTFPRSTEVLRQRDAFRQHFTSVESKGSATVPSSDMGSSVSHHVEYARPPPATPPAKPAAPASDAQDSSSADCWSCRLLSGSALFGAGAYVYLLGQRPMKRGLPVQPGSIAQMVVGVCEQGAGAAEVGRGGRLGAGAPFPALSYKRGARVIYLSAMRWFYKWHIRSAE